MFILDGGRTRRDHRVFSERPSFNSKTIGEISPGHLLDMHFRFHVPSSLNQGVTRQCQHTQKVKKATVTTR